MTDLVDTHGHFLDRGRHAGSRVALLAGGLADLVGSQLHLLRGSGELTCAGLHIAAKFRNEAATLLKLPATSPQFITCFQFDPSGQISRSQLLRLGSEIPHPSISE